MRLSTRLSNHHKTVHSTVQPSRACPLDCPTITRLSTRLSNHHKTVHSTVQPSCDCPLNCPTIMRLSTQLSNQQSSLPSIQPRSAQPPDQPTSQATEKTDQPSGCPATPLPCLARPQARACARRAMPTSPPLGARSRAARSVARRHTAAPAAAPQTARCTRRTATCCASCAPYSMSTWSASQTSFRSGEDGAVLLVERRPGVLHQVYSVSLKTELLLALASSRLPRLAAAWRLPGKNQVTIQGLKPSEDPPQTPYINPLHTRSIVPCSCRRNAAGSKRVATCL
eukprot:364929-Chlamydomonas_euryale.AAC.6